jgi:hypothetical protein
MSTSFILNALILLSIAVFFWTCKSSIEAFEDVKMRPWFGYEPGYGPGWGRKGCCNTATDESIKANNLA